MRIRQTLKSLSPVALLLCLTFALACGAPPLEENSGESEVSAVTTLHIHYPGNGHAITVRGSSGTLSWSSSAAASSQDGQTWTVTVSKAKGTLQFKPLLDDQSWSIGPNYAVKAGSSVEVWPHFHAVTGTVTRIDGWYSNDLANTRPVYVYTPPGYSEQTGEAFPVIYMHDGQNLFDAYADDSFSGTTWSVDGALDRGSRDGSIREAIVVGIGNTDNRTWELTPNDSGDGDTGGGAATYLSFVAQELKPQIDAHYRTLPDRANTLMIGSSLGGLTTGCAGLWDASTFGAVGVMSPATWWASEWITAQIAASKHQPVKPLRVYVDSGNAGPDNDDVTYTKALAAAYRSAGYPSVVSQVGNGDQHEEAAWARRLPGALAYLLGNRGALP
jgi:predicted alpha/beta superfamily hydrolase